MSDERYHPSYMNKEEYDREQRRQKDMVESIVRGHLQREGKKTPARPTREYLGQGKEKTLKRLSQSLDKLEKAAKELAEITKALRNRS